MSDSLRDIMASFKPGTSCPPPPCDRCKARPAWHGQGLCERCGEELAWAQAMKAARVSVPPRFRDLRLGTDELGARLAGGVMPREVQSALAPAPRVGPVFVVIVGRVGAGKTSLAAAMFHQWCDVHRCDAPSARFVTARELAAARQRTPLGSTPAVLEDSTRAALLVVDDLGSEPRHELSAVPDVIRDRYDWNRTTWITTALSQEELAEAFSSAGVGRRVYEDALVIRLGMGS